MSADALLAADVAALPDEEVRRHVRALYSLAAQAEAAALAAVDVLARRGLWAGDGARTAAAWLGPRVDLLPGRARRDVELARALRHCPVVAAAYGEGRLSRTKVEMLVEVRTPEVEATFAEHEAHLVAEVERLAPVQARCFVRGWHQQARLAIGWIDPDAPVDEREPRCAVHLDQTFGGRFVLHGEMDAEHGERVRTVVDAEVDARYRAGVYGPDDGLSGGERRGLALFAVLSRQGRVGIRNGEVRPSIEVSTDVRTLLGLPIDDADDLRSRRCETRAGNPVRPQTLARLACTAVVTMVLTDGAGHVLDVGHGLRLATRRQRRALAFEHRGCQFPGCSAPADWCETHHITPFRLSDLTGPTDMANLCLLCAFHHHLCHEGGFRLARGPDGQVVVRRPDGTPVDRCRSRARGPAPPTDREHPHAA